MDNYGYEVWNGKRGPLTTGEGEGYQTSVHISMYCLHAVYFFDRGLLHPISLLLLLQPFWMAGPVNIGVFGTTDNYG